MAIKCIETATFLFLGLEKSVKTSSKNISSNFGIDLSRKYLFCCSRKSNISRNVSDKSKIAEGLQDYICCFIICYEDQDKYIPADAICVILCSQLVFQFDFQRNCICAF